jgi:hypothetical protein
MSRFGAAHPAAVEKVQYVEMIVLDAKRDENVPSCANASVIFSINTPNPSPK